MILKLDLFFFSILFLFFIDFSNQLPTKPKPA